MASFGIGVTPETLSTLRFLGIVPLAVALLLTFTSFGGKHRGMILIIAWVAYLLYQAGIFLFVHAG